MSSQRTEYGEPSSLDIIYDLAIKRLDAQIGEIESVDVKLRNTFWFMSSITGVLLAYLSSRQFQWEFWVRPYYVPLVFIILSLGTYFAIIVLSLLAYRFAEPGYLPNISELRDEALLSHPHITKHAILYVVVKQLEENRSLVTRKLFYAKCVFWLTFAEVVFAVISLIALTMN